MGTSWVAVSINNVTTRASREMTSRKNINILDFIGVKVFAISDCLVVRVIYRPNTLPLADVDIFTTTLFGVMDEINHENKKCVIMGDMNINMLNYGVHNQTDTYVDGIFSRGFLPQILMPTRVTHRSATLIDHLLTNDITYLFP